MHDISVATVQQQQEWEDLMVVWIADKKTIAIITRAS